VGVGTTVGVRVGISVAVGRLVTVGEAVGAKVGLSVAVGELVAVGKEVGVAVGITMIRRVGVEVGSKIRVGSDRRRGVGVETCWGGGRPTIVEVFVIVESEPERGSREEKSSGGFLVIFSALSVFPLRVKIPKDGRNEKPVYPKPTRRSAISDNKLLETTISLPLTIKNKPDD